MMFLVSLSSGAIAGLGVSLSLEAASVDWVNGGVLTNCEEAVKRGEYIDQSDCVITTYKYFTFLSLGPYVASFFGFIALTLFAIAIIVLRKHLRTMRQAQ